MRWRDIRASHRKKARKAAGLTQKAVAERLPRGDGRKVLPLFLNDLEHDRLYPPRGCDDRATRQDPESFVRCPLFLLEAGSRGLGGGTPRIARLRPLTASLGRSSMRRRRNLSLQNLGARLCSKIRLAVLGDRNRIERVIDMNTQKR
jgi:hypothetical protein